MHMYERNIDLTDAAAKQHTFLFRILIKINWHVKMLQYSAVVPDYTL